MLEEGNLISSLPPKNNRWAQLHSVPCTAAVREEEQGMEQIRHDFATHDFKGGSLS